MLLPVTKLRPSLQLLMCLKDGGLCLVPQDKPRRLYPFRDKLLQHRYFLGLINS